MKTEPIVRATIDFASDPLAPRAPAFDDLYHPREGALEQARAVFLAGNGLPARWQSRARFTVVEIGLGLGVNFLATWAAWRDDPQRCERLHYVAFEQHPPCIADLARAHSALGLDALARELRAAWPPATPNVHQLDFEHGRVQLLLVLGDAQRLAPETVAQADAFFLDGFAPSRNAACWSPQLLAALARMAAPGATAATWSAARAVRDALGAAGFAVEASAGPGRKRDITLARYAPRFVPPRPPGRAWVAQPLSEAIVVGAGIAGAAVARALARQGVAVRVFDRAETPAAQASGNPAGLFHGTVGSDDTRHARLHRAASFHAAAWVHDSGAGVANGLLRLNESGDLASMRALLDAQRLPADYLEALGAEQASQRAGVALERPAWWFARGGHADPVALVRHALSRPGVQWCAGRGVHALEPCADGHRLLDDAGRELGRAPLVVLASGHDALRLAGLPPAWAARSRGQLSWCIQPLDLRVPVASGAYVLALPDGRLLFGATAQFDDRDPHVRASDHAANLAAARRLLGRALPDIDPATLDGRVGWRVVTRDRLPLAGPVPDLDAPQPRRRDAPRLVPRRAGLFLLTGLGSRGLTTAALCGELIAAQATGAPWPLEADLADALDPARLAL